MAWWDKAVTNLKSAVNKAKASVEKVKETIKKTISESVETAKKVVKKVKEKVKKTISESVETAKKVVKKVKETTTEIIIPEIAKKIQTGNEAIEKAKGLVLKEAEDIVIKGEGAVGGIEKMKEAEDEEIRKVELERVEKTEPEWTEKLTTAIIDTFKIKLPFFSNPTFKTVAYAWEKITGKKMAKEEADNLKAHLADWIIPINAITKLLTGKNIDGEVEEFGTGTDYFDLATGILLFVPIGKVGTIVGKLGSKGFMKIALTKSDDAIRIFRRLNVDDQAKMLRGLAKTDDGVKMVNKLLERKALDKTLVKPTMAIVNKAIQNKILVGSGFGALIRKATKPKTILWGLSGMLGAIGGAYGLAFGTEWFAKEGLWELYAFPLGDKIRDYRFEPTLDKAERIKKSLSKVRETLPKAQALIKSVAWLWPPTKDEWLEWADGIEFELEQMEDEFKSIILPELIELPEEIESPVRDIIDGDTIDVSLDGTVNGEAFKLPEYKKTNHARIRIVGMNTAEKSPKGEIACTGIEIFKVEGTYADEARNRLMPLNDKKVILRIDPENKMDGFGRILAVVERNSEDIGLRQIKEGLACYYFREAHKHVDDALYEKETTKAKKEGIGMWSGLEDVEKEEDKIKIKINSVPKNARLFLDDVALRHNTPSDEVELKDVLHLFTKGSHVLSAEKGGISATLDIEIKKGDNGEFNLILETTPITPEEEEVEISEIIIQWITDNPTIEILPHEEDLITEELEKLLPTTKEKLKTEIPSIITKIKETEEPPIEEPVIEEPPIEEPVIEEPLIEVKPEAPILPKIEYTTEQEWALKEAFRKIWEEIEGTEVMSKLEREMLIESFGLYSDEQKMVLLPLWTDLEILTSGTSTISKEEFINLLSKHQIEMMI